MHIYMKFVNMRLEIEKQNTLEWIINATKHRSHAVTLRRIQRKKSNRIQGNRHQGSG